MGLRVEVDELHAGGTRMAQSVTAPVTVGSTPVAPAAGDQVSATVATGLSARLETIGVHSARAASITSTAAGVLQANAGTYREQEDLNAAALRPDGAATAGLAAPTAGPASATALPAAIAPVAPVGVTPTDGKGVAVLIHGGTGPEPLLAAAGTARAHAAELRQISSRLRAVGYRPAVD